MVVGATRCFEREKERERERAYTEVTQRMIRGGLVCYGCVCYSQIGERERERERYERDGA